MLPEKLQSISESCLGCCRRSLDPGLLLKALECRMQQEHSLGVHSVTIKLKRSPNKDEMETDAPIFTGKGPESLLAALSRINPS